MAAIIKKEKGDEEMRQTIDALQDSLGMYAGRVKVDISLQEFLQQYS